jgi:hypothetical protein
MGDEEFYPSVISQNPARSLVKPGGSFKGGNTRTRRFFHETHLERSLKETQAVLNFTKHIHS